MAPSSISGVEVVHLERGSALSVRTLSVQAESRAVRRAVGLVALSVLAAALLGLGMARLLQKAVYVPAFVGVWTLTALLAGTYAARKVRGRLGRYTIGPRLESDAFAQVPVDFSLVTRCADRFELTLIPGMHGHIEGGRMPLPVEALVNGPRTVVGLDPDSTAKISLGTSQFIIRSRRCQTDAHPERAHAGVGAPMSVSTQRGKWRSVLGVPLLAVQLGLVATLFCLVPGSRAIDDRLVARLARKVTTPWEAEKWMRLQAQLQAPSLYTCFDALPMSCQRPGFVGVGVAVSRDGEIRSQWIARSTYGADCPVEKCMSEVISTWDFDPVPQAMRVILPVQVLRTEKPLVGLRVAAGDEPAHGFATISWSAVRERE